MLTLLMPGGLLFYGSQEVGFDRPVASEPKSIPFSVPVQVDWKGTDPDTAAFYRDTFSTARRLRQSIPGARLVALPKEGSARWVGYALVREGSRRASALILANPGDALRYVLRPALSIKRLSYQPEKDKVCYRPSKGRPEDPAVAHRLCRKGRR